jgi:aspartate carbamoyltransferase catalytic subunit
MASFKGLDIISTRTFTKPQILKIFDVAKSMEISIRLGTCLKLLEGKILGCLFFQPSTRTRLSFESAMQRLGGGVIGFADPSVSRAYGPRAETLEDTIRTVERYCDTIVIRHPESGVAQLAAEIARVPILNAGDGTNEHPTQGLLDAYTMWREKGRLDGLTVGLVGDIARTRGMRSLLYVLGKFNLKLILVAPTEIRLTEEQRQFLKNNAIDFTETTDLKSAVREMDVLYTTRLNKEGAKTEDEYNKLLKSYPRITLDILRNAKEDLIVLHDLPRTDELGLHIAAEVDNTPHAKYFDEVEYGVAVRMALLALILGAIE